MAEIEGQKVKRFSLSKEEKEKIQNIQSVMGIIAIQREGLNHSLMLEIARARDRLGITEEKAPEGYVRLVNFDPDKFELVVTDTKPMEKPKEPKEPEAK